MSETKSVASRRNVLKGAAWTAPVVVMATAAPAFAASGAASLTAAISAATALNTPRRVDVRSTLSNINDQASTALSATVTVTLSASSWGATPSATAAGYTGGTPAGTGATRSFTFSAVQQIAGNDSKAFDPVVVTGGTSNVAGSVVVSADPGSPGTGGTSAPRTIA